MNDYEPGEKVYVVRGTHKGKWGTVLRPCNILRKCYVVKVETGHQAHIFPHDLKRETGPTMTAAQFAAVVDANQWGVSVRVLEELEAAVPGFTRFVGTMVYEGSSIVGRSNY